MLIIFLIISDCRQLQRDCSYGNNNNNYNWKQQSGRSNYSIHGGEEISKVLH